MLFWIYLILCGLAAYVGVRKGLYVLLGTLFNLLVAVYVSVLAGPLVISLNPELGESGYSAAACVFGMGAAIFCVLQLIAYCFFFRNSEEIFPNLLDKIGGGALGFAFGAAALSFLLMLVCMMPFSRTGWFSSICPRDRAAACAGSIVVKSCHFIAEYSLECFEQEPQEAVELLLETGAAGQNKPSNAL